MFDLQELYQEVVLDHNRRPRNFKRPDYVNRTAEGFNPLCGDQVNVYLNVEDDVITDVGFEGVGCAISKASTSMMTESVKGRTTAEAEEIFSAFRAMVTGKADGASDVELLGDLEVFQGVSQYPARIKCATLSWHALQAALDSSGETVATE
jgi:nitrogen fixation NifU-like protein